MKVERSDFGYHLILDAGEDIEAGLLRFAHDHSPPSCHIVGIGSVQDLVLGHFDSVVGELVERRFTDSLELTSFIGNLTWLRDEPLLHAHAMAADREFRVVGGHFVSGRISVTGEFALILDRLRIIRQQPEGKPYGLVVEFL